jgi:hypothetical protein
MIGSPLPIAILNRSYDAGEIRVISGRPDLAEIEFTDGIGFTAITPGRFIGIFSTDTRRQPLSVAVTTPTAAAIARNSNEWKALRYDQLMYVDYAPNGAGNYWNVNSSSVQTRNYMPFQHVSQSWMCELDADEDSSLALTIADATQLRWMLAVIRLPSMNEENRDSNIFKSASVTSSSGVTRSLMSGPQRNFPRWQVSSTVAAGEATFTFQAPPAGVDYISRVRLVASLPTIAGTVTATLRKNSTDIGSSVMTIPFEGEQLWEFSVASGVFNGTDIASLVITGIDSGKRFILETSFDAII